MEYAIRLLEQKMADLMIYNLRASKIKCADSERDVKINEAIIKELEAAIEKLKGE